MENQSKIIAKALFLATQNKPKENQEKIVRNLINFLKKKRQIYLLPAILNDYQKYLKLKRSFLTFAHKPDREILEKIKKVFKDILKGAEKIQIKIDKEITGGFIVKTENTLIDASIKGILRKIKEKILR